MRFGLPAGADGLASPGMIGEAAAPPTPAAIARSIFLRVMIMFLLSNKGAGHEMNQYQMYNTTVYQSTVFTIMPSWQVPVCYLLP